MSAAPQAIAPSKLASEFLARRHLLLIGGEWVEPADRGQIPVHDPATEALLTRVACAGEVDVDRAVAAARAALRGPWSRLSAHERSRLIWRLADELVGSSRVDLQACKLEYSIVSPK